MVAPADRFWSKVDKAGPIHPYDPALGACWMWMGDKERFGYGKFPVTTPMVAIPEGRRPRRCRTLMAHRFAWEMAHGAPPPKGMVVMHSCDVPGCVNPDHLSIGTQAENRADCERKGRGARGERHGSRTCPGALPSSVRHYRATMTAEMVLEIRRLHAGGMGPAAIARKMGIERVLRVNDITQGKTYRDVKFAATEAAA